MLHNSPHEHLIIGLIVCPDGFSTGTQQGKFDKSLFDLGIVTFILEITQLPVKKKTGVFSSGFSNIQKLNKQLSQKRLIQM